MLSNEILKLAALKASEILSNGYTPAVSGPAGEGMSSTKNQLVLMTLLDPQAIGSMVGYSGSRVLSVSSSLGMQVNTLLDKDNGMIHWGIDDAPPSQADLDDIKRELGNLTRNQLTDVVTQDDGSLNKKILDAYRKKVGASSDLSSQKISSSDLETLRIRFNSIRNKLKEFVEIRPQYESFPVKEYGIAYLYAVIQDYMNRSSDLETDEFGNLIALLALKKLVQEAPDPFGQLISPDALLSNPEAYIEKEVILQNYNPNFPLYPNAATVPSYFEQPVTYPTPRYEIPEASCFWGVTYPTVITHLTNPDDRYDVLYIPETDIEVPRDNGRYWGDFVYGFYTNIQLIEQTGPGPTDYVLTDIGVPVLSEWRWCIDLGSITTQYILDNPEGSLVIRNYQSTGIVTDVAIPVSDLSPVDRGGHPRDPYTVSMVGARCFDISNKQMTTLYDWQEALPSVYEGYYSDDAAVPSRWTIPSSSEWYSPSMTFAEFTPMENPMPSSATLSSSSINIDFKPFDIPWWIGHLSYELSVISPHFIYKDLSYHSNAFSFDWDPEVTKTVTRFVYSAEGKHEVKRYEYNGAHVDSYIKITNTNLAFIPFEEGDRLISVDDPEVLIIPAMTVDSVSKSSIDFVPITPGTAAHWTVQRNGTFFRTCELDGNTFDPDILIEDVLAEFPDYQRLSLSSNATENGLKYLGDGYWYTNSVINGSLRVTLKLVGGSDTISAKVDAPVILDPYNTGDITYYQGLSFYDFATDTVYPVNYFTTNTNPYTVEMGEITTSIEGPIVVGGDIWFGPYGRLVWYIENVLFKKWDEMHDLIRRAKNNPGVEGYQYKTVTVLNSSPGFITVSEQIPNPYLGTNIREAGTTFVTSRKVPLRTMSIDGDIIELSDPAFEVPIGTTIDLVKTDLSKAYYYLTEVDKTLKFLAINIPNLHPSGDWYAKLIERSRALGETDISASLENLRLTEILHKIDRPTVNTDLIDLLDNLGG